MSHLTIECILSFCSSLGICLLLIPGIISASIRLKLVDKPNERKVHKFPIPRLGGIGIFTGTFCGILLCRQGWQGFSQWPVLFSGMGVLFVVGIWDDVKNLSPRLRLLVQVCCAAAVTASGIRLHELYGIFWIHAMPVVWQYIVTIVIIVGVTNAFNLIDGVDGLAGGLALISMLVLAWLAWCLHEPALLISFLAFAGALTGFLRYNFSPASIFMGDGGSLILGYWMSVCGILLIMRAGAQVPNPLDSGVLPPSATPVTPSETAILVTAILIIPVFDSLRVFASRMFRGHSPFRADKTHIHHLFLVAGLDHRKTCIILCGFQLLLVALAILLPYTTGMSITILLMVILFHFITRILRLNQEVERWQIFIRKIEMEGIR